MTDICLRAWNWCRRFRKRCGYGVHSPSDFFLITFVVYEKLPFYAYKTLHKLRKDVNHLPHFREKIDKLFLRLVNYCRPSLLLEVGTGSGLQTLYMAAGNAQMEIVTSTDECRQEVQNLLAEYPRIAYGQVDIEEMLHKWKEKNTSSVMVHIAHTSHYKECFEQFLPMAGEHTCFVIGSPYADKAKKQWWKQVIADERTGVTFDLYDIGLVFFDRKRVKEHRVVNFL